MAEPQALTYEQWWKACTEYYRKDPGSVRRGQAIMNVSPVEWRDILPDIWEIDSLSHPQVLVWDAYAAETLD